MLKRYAKILSNPLLYYADGKSGKSVFRNFCLFENTGCSYDMNLPKANVGKVLEFRFQLDKYLNRINFFTPVVLYFIFIHLKCSFLLFAGFILLWVLTVCVARLICSAVYGKFLVKNFGKYNIVRFTPPVSKEKSKEYLSIFRARVIAVILLIGMYFMSSFVLSAGIRVCLKQRFLNPKLAVKLSNIYFGLYPKSRSVYGMRAYAKFKLHDYEGALADYKADLDISGRRFKDSDLTEFANLLYLQKKLTNPQDAVDVFNEYVTKKKPSVLQESKILWIKSIFKIENNISDNIARDYDLFLESLNPKDTRNRFYISSDKAYIRFLNEEYESALKEYDSLIATAEGSGDTFSKELPGLYAERGWTKIHLGDQFGANSDFVESGIEYSQLKKYEPSYSLQEFLVEKF